MSTVIRPELSRKNRYFVEKHRYYELKHFCLQYPLWKKLYSDLDGLGSRISDLSGGSRSNTPGDPTAACVDSRLYYLERMEMIEQAAIEADPDLSTYIIKAVTEELSYPHLKSRLEIPCSKDTYYDRYRKFFWLLNKRRK